MCTSFFKSLITAITGSTRVKMKDWHMQNTSFYTLHFPPNTAFDLVTAIENSLLVFENIHQCMYIS